VLGHLRGKSLLVIGAGRMAEATAKHLARQGAAPITVANRTLERAQEVAQRLGGEADTIADLPHLLLAADVVITCTSAPHFILDAEQVQRAAAHRSGRPMVIIDVSMPRDVEPRAGTVPGVRLFNLDDLEPLVADRQACAGCHSGIAAHLEDPSQTPSNPGDMPGEQASAVCLSCHKADQMMWASTSHSKLQKGCLTCHDPHNGEGRTMLREEESELCSQCHPGHHDGHRTPLVALEASAAGAAQAVTAIEGFYDKCTSCHPLIHGTDLGSQTRLRSNDPANKGGTFMPGYASTPLGRTSATNPGCAWGVASLAGLAMQGDGASWGFSGIELGALDEDGNPTYVREYDGKNYEFPRAKLGLDQYAAKSDFHLRADGPAAGDPQAEAYFGSPTLSANVKYNELTHRQPRFNDIEGQVDFPGNYIVVTDEDDGKNDYAINRKVTDINLAARHPRLRQVKWLAHYWRESESGSQQFLYMERCAGCHKSQTTQPMDRVTTEVAGGAQIEFDKGALRYMHT